MNISILSLNNGSLIVSINIAKGFNHKYSEYFPNLSDDHKIGVINVIKGIKILIRCSKSLKNKFKIEKKIETKNKKTKHKIILKKKISKLNKLKSLDIKQ